MNLKKIGICTFWFFFASLIDCDAQKPIQIAFLADVHLHDVHAEFQNAGYKGIKDPKTGAYYTIRTMDAQLRSTRLFNENYFAFLAALDELVSKNINLVVLPGDFSDDGQPINIKALKKILNAYCEQYGMQFFLTTGNHDPVRPFLQEGGKHDFLGDEGQRQIIVSDSSLVRNHAESLPAVVTQEIKKWGYKEIVNELADFGFFPRKEFLYWETPYSTYTYETYSLQKAVMESNFKNRKYKITGSTVDVPDMSYLVEPVHGIWLLAIDANVYVPKENGSDTSGFSGAGMGYNNVIQYKKHLIAWVKKVSSEAKRKGKTLIAFSHYPMVEFYDGASSEIRALFGDHKMQLHRIPKDMVSETFADAGIQIHLGGHMHMNDTGIFTSKKGNTLFNIQIPSLAAYMPAYKVLTLHSHTELKIETSVLQHVRGFDSFFPLYKKEHEYLKKTNSPKLWNNEILASKSYKGYVEKHLEALVQSRFLPNDWPISFSEQLVALTGKELLLSTKNSDKDSLQDHLDNAGLTLNGFDKWNGADMIYDFYRLRGGDELSFVDIGKHKLKQYDILCRRMRKSENTEFALWATIFYKAYHGAPSVNFKIDLSLNTIRNVYE
ncbi:MAG: metallophosphoesterase [Saonia sp.]